LQIITLKHFDFGKFIFLISTAKYGRIKRNAPGMRHLQTYSSSFMPRCEI